MKSIYIMILALLLNYINADCQWERVYKHYQSNMGLAQWDMDCADNLNCISVAQERMIKTTDGGYNWFVQFSDTAREIYNDKGQLIDMIPSRFKPARCIDYVTPSFAVAGHQEGQITITRDGGIAWDSINLNTTYDFLKIQFTDENYGVAFAYQDVFKTYDGGYNWEKIDLEYQKERDTWEVNMAVAGKDSIIIVSYDRTDTSNKFYTIFKTTDGGETWGSGNKIPKYSDWFPYFSDINHGWLTGRVGAGSGTYFDLIYYTSDGGETWKTQLDTLLYPQLGLNDIYFKDTNEGLAYGGGGKIWRTTNGGLNWIQDKSFPFEGSDHFKKLVFPNVNTKKILANVYLFGEIWMYEDITSVDENVVGTNDLIIAPNPAGDYIEINLNNESSLTVAGKVQIFNILGIEVINVGTGLDLSTQSINISHLPVGVYYIKIKDRVEKFVKM